VSFLPFFQWCEASWLGQLIRTSEWLFPVLEAIHLVGLCLLGGALLLVDLRMLGFGLTNQTIPNVHQEAQRWLNGAVATMVTTGSLLFISEAVKCYYNPAFWIKITTLPVAVAFTYTLRAAVARRAISGITATTRWAAIGSLAVWFTVAAAGRWIGFSS
jgi:hypothetical protein